MFSTGFQDRVYDRMADSRWGRRGALWLRNASTQVLAHRLAPTIDPDRNGETLLLTTLAPNLRHVIDVGANRGEWTQRVLEAAGGLEQIVCYEPGADAHARISRRFEDSRVIVVEAAVSDQAGSHEFFEVSDAGETSSLVAVQGDAPHLRRTVRVVTIDEEIERLGLGHVDLLKIDVEGLDLHVLRGAERALAAQRVDVVQFEYNSTWALAGSTLASAFQLLRTHGYAVHALLSDGLHDYEPTTFGELFVYSNFVAYRPGAEPLLCLTGAPTF